MHDGSVIVDERNPRWLLPSLGEVAERLAEAWSHGVAPVAGALRDQPARAMALIRLWNIAWNRCEGQKFDEEQAKRNRNVGG